MKNRTKFILKDTNNNKYMDIAGKHEGEAGFKIPSSFDSYQKAEYVINTFLPEFKDDLKIVPIKLKDYIDLFLDGVDTGKNKFKQTSI
jgi:hypothetical protein